MKVFSIVLMSSAFLISGAAMATEPSRPADANQFYGEYDSPSQSAAPADADRSAFDHSGTRGRHGLGASAFHPEGPGEVVE